MIGFHEVRFPEDVSWGSKGGPVYKTQVFTSHRGWEKRNIDWSQPMMQFNAAYGIRTDAQILNVINFFNARQGRLFGFRYKSWTNYRVESAPIATGDGESLRLPLYKFFGFAGARHYKRLRKIVRGSVTNVSAGGEVLIEGEDFRIDYDGGEIVTNAAVGHGIPIMALTLEFDEPVRFEEDSVENVIEQYNNNSLSALDLVSIRGTFTAGSAFNPDQTETGDVDPHYGRTMLLLNFDSATTPTEVDDQSPIKNAISFNGTAALSGDSYRHGSAAFRAGTNGYISAPGSPYKMGDAPFTMELFATRPTEGADMQPMVSLWNEPTSEGGYSLYFNQTTHRVEFKASTNGVDARVILTHPWETSPGFFDHISVDRLTSGWFVLRINGKVKQSTRDTLAIHPSVARLTVGGVAAPVVGEGSFQGIIDSVRITGGYARNGNLSDATVPAPYSVT